MIAGHLISIFIKYLLRMVKMEKLLRIILKVNPFQRHKHPKRYSNFSHIDASCCRCDASKAQATALSTVTLGQEWGLAMGGGEVLQRYRES